MGTAYCPYRIGAEREFFDGLRDYAYVVKDRSENLERHCMIPYHRGYSLDRYFGFYLSRAH